jgi:hypothetical protein
MASVLDSIRTKPSALEFAHLILLPLGVSKYIFSNLEILLLVMQLASKCLVPLLGICHLLRIHMHTIHLLQIN